MGGFPPPTTADPSASCTPADRAADRAPDRQWSLVVDPRRGRAQVGSWGVEMQARLQLVDDMCLEAARS